MKISFVVNRINLVKPIRITNENVFDADLRKIRTIPITGLNERFIKFQITMQLTIKHERKCLTKTYILLLSQLKERLENQSIETLEFDFFRSVTENFKLCKEDELKKVKLGKKHLETFKLTQSLMNSGKERMNRIYEDIKNNQIKEQLYTKRYQPPEKSPEEQNEKLIESDAAEEIEEWDL